MGKEAPTPPDPAVMAKQQHKQNVKTAQAQQKLGMTGQETPWGTLNYVTDPTSPSGYRAVTDLSPEERALLQQSQDVRAQFGGITGAQLGRVGDRMAEPWEMDAARGKQISDIQRTFMDPQFQQREDALKTDLLNRGIRPGSEQYDIAMKRFTSERDAAYNRMYLDAWSQAGQAALTERNLPFSDLAAIRGTQLPGAPGTPQFAPTPTPGVAPTDVMTPQMQAFQQQQAGANQQMGGLYGLGSSVLGGWAQAGFPGASAAGSAVMSALPLIFSDRRVKRDITKVASDPRGWGVYRFRYVWDTVKRFAWRLGFMADEVERTRPDAVYTDPVSGLKLLDYEALAS